LKAIELDPKLTLARDALAAVYLARGKTDEAIAQSKAAYGANATDETALYHLILALRKSGKTEELPHLLNELTQLKKRNQAQQILERKYAIVDQPLTGGEALRAPQ